MTKSVVFDLQSITCQQAYNEPHALRACLQYQEIVALVV